MSADRGILGGLVTRQGLLVFVCDLLKPWAGAEAGFPGAVDAPSPALESRPPDPGSGAPPGTRFWVSRGSGAPGSGLHQPVSNFLCLYVRH